MGGYDFDIITLNKKTLSELNNFSKIEIVPHTTRLFEEERTLRKAAKLFTN